MTPTPGTLQIIRGNALALPVADSSVDLIVTSPPYFGLRSYQDGGEHYAGQIGAEATPREFVDALIAATAEMVRVLKPSGSIFVNLGDKYDSDKSLRGLPWRYAIRCMDDLGLVLRAEVVWSKPNRLPPNATDRVQRSHEQWFHFTVQSSYFASLDEIREPVVNVTTQRSDRGGAGKHSRLDKSKSDQDGIGRTWSSNPLGKLPVSVWTIATQPLKVPPELGIEHSAAFPMEWPRRIVKAWSPAGGTVLDPFGGTGTTGIVARALGRHGISVDMSADYCRLAEWRASDPKQLAKAAG